MDWQSFAVSFAIVFLSELGDKSQLVAITLGSNARSATAVFLGVASGLVCTTFFGVLLGSGIATLIPVKVVKAIAAMMFAFLGFYLLSQTAANSLDREQI
ncbi:MULTISPECIES: TMEM165/GDT1 family protein [unclassified Thermosynechococcus]|uniref:TMEM165/GDT1 family protein n=1 Tax=unclassified Thermosynechococcus TaxID=2622553 RepID=UPI001A019BE7|nr:MULTISPECIES: TMEM165/GDT1 family protein [unclassified Thermosynechococcus]HIK35890.1 TMEM165/GDT1 family protein [Thermosynechococcus sp. M98_K2018_005]HIK47588.1 TMEM165/GDT1 family protein [Thermosynechococcus sp. M55_K2018_012]